MDIDIYENKINKKSIEIKKRIMRIIYSKKYYEEDNICYVNFFHIFWVS